MTDTTTILVLASGVVIAIGSAVESQLPDAKMIIGSGIVVISLSAMDNWQPEMSSAFAALILLALLFKYLPPIVQKLGYSAGQSGKSITIPKKTKTDDSNTDTNTPTADNRNASAFVPSVPDGGTPSTASPQNSTGIIVA